MSRDPVRAKFIDDALKYAKNFIEAGKFPAIPYVRQLLNECNFAPVSDTTIATAAKKIGVRLVPFRGQESMDTRKLRLDTIKGFKQRESAGVALENRSLAEQIDAAIAALHLVRAKAERTDKLVRALVGESS